MLARRDVRKLASGLYARRLPTGLRVLKKSGIVRERDEQRRCYRVSIPVVQPADY